MRFLCFYKPAAKEGLPPTHDEITRMGALIDQMTKAGTLEMTEGCKSSTHGARVRRDAGKFTVIDGPFTEAKEIIGGLAIIHAASKAEAIELTKNFLNVAGDGESEVRELYSPEDFGPPPAN